MNTDRPSGTPSDTRGFRTVRSLHPTVAVPELSQADRLFRQLFGVPSVAFQPFESCQTVRDVFFATIAPDLYVVDGFQSHPTVDAAKFTAFSWYVDDIEVAYRECKKQGLRLTDSRENPIENDELPTIGPYRQFCTGSEATGLKYSIFEDAHVPLDPRTHQGWQLTPVRAEDPLGLVFSSHHTILTRSPERALKLVVDVLGGTIIHEGRNELIGASSTYVFVGDSVVEYAVPDAGTEARAAWAREIPKDTYHSINWQVEDLARAQQYLRAQGMKIQARSADAILTDQSTSLLRWGFSEALVPGDPRLDESVRLQHR